MIEAEASAANSSRVDLATRPDFDLGAARVRPSRRQLLFGPNDMRTVEPRVMQVLVALAEAGGAVVTRDQLNDLCWDGRIVGDDSINRCILALRRLARSVDPPPFQIETVARVGYALILPSRSVSAYPSGRATAPALAKVAKSVAVLPFVNLTGDPAKDYLGDGMAEELITTLSRASDLKVPARTSAFTYKGRNLDVRSIACELGVGAVLEGSVRVAGQRIRVTAQLIDAESGFPLWSQSFDRDLGDLFALQDELASSIANTLQAKVGHRLPQPADPRAYEIYLQARGLLSRATPDSLLRAIELHEEAIARDQGFARAWGGLAGALTVATLFGVLPLERRVDARASAEQAIRLDRGYAEPHAVLGALNTAEGRWLEAEAGFRAAMALDPEEPTTMEGVALHLLAPCGRLRTALEMTKKATRLAPASVSGHWSCALIADLCGEREARKIHFDTAVLLGLSKQGGAVRVYRSEIARESGCLEEAAEKMAGAFRMTFPGQDSTSPDLVRHVYAALAGKADPSAASRAVADFATTADRDEALWRVPALPGYLLLWQVLLGQVDEAFAIADRIVAAWHRSGHLAAASLPIVWRQEMQPFRRDVRFQRLVEQIGMIPFWRQHGPPDGYRLEGDRLIESAAAA